MVYRIATIRWPWVTFKVIHLSTSLLESDLSYSCAAVVKISTDSVARSLCDSWASCRRQPVVQCAALAATSIRSSPVVVASEAVAAVAAAAAAAGWAARPVSPCEWPRWRPCRGGWPCAEPSPPATSPACVASPPSADEDRAPPGIYRCTALSSPSAWSRNIQPTYTVTNTARAVDTTFLSQFSKNTSSYSKK